MSQAQPLVLSPDDKAKIKNMIEVGIRTTQEIQDLKEGLKETVKELADELDIKPAVLNKAIRVAFKSSVSTLQEEVDTVEEILHAAGRV
jgi:guanylate kinase